MTEEVKKRKEEEEEQTCLPIAHPSQQRPKQSQMDQLSCTAPHWAT